MNKYAFLIPFYNHPNKINELCEALKKYNLEILIVNDGSNEESSKIINAIDGVKILNLAQNMGKGAAIKAGVKFLLENDFTHALQLDADMQHNILDIPKFLKQSEDNENSLICGSPVYDDSAPKSRMLGRKLTNFWIYINTFGGLKDDGMCGFRLYPIKLLKNIFADTKGNKMDFDIEILVRAYWAKINFKWIKTKVKYEPSNISHFKSFEDNYLISSMHTRMFFYMLYNILRGKNV